MMGNYYITWVCHESLCEKTFSAPSILDHWINWETADGMGKMASPYNPCSCNYPLNALACSWNQKKRRRKKKKELCLVLPLRGGCRFLLGNRSVSFLVRHVTIYKPFNNISGLKSFQMLFVFWFGKIRGLFWDLLSMAVPQTWIFVTLFVCSILFFKFLYSLYVVPFNALSHTFKKIGFWRWRRNRTGRSLSLLQIHRKNNRTVKKVYKTTSDR